MKMKDKIEKQAKDMVDLALQWQKLSQGITVSTFALKEFQLFDAMQAEVLKTYTNIEELSKDVKKD